MEKTVSEISMKDVKIFFDQEGQAREVLLSYETFLRLEALLREMAGKDQVYFWTEEWQKRIRDAEDDIAAGRVYRTARENVESVLKWLDE